MKEKRKILLAVFVLMTAVLCVPGKAEAAQKAKWKEVDGVYYAYQGT